MVALRNKWSGSTAKVGSAKVSRAYTVREQMLRVDRRQWWVWGYAIVVTLALTAGLFSFTFPFFTGKVEPFYNLDLKQSVEGLFALVLIFDVYSIYQQLQI